MSLSIGRLSSRTGCPVQTIRYYEKVGLLPKPGRTEGNQRRFDDSHAARLAFIRHSRELGFPLERIRDLLELADDDGGRCEEIDAIAREHLAEVNARIHSLTALREELERMLDHNTGDARHCRILEVLADASHQHCLHPDHGKTP